MVYELFYHPGFTGRLEPILTLLADAGIKYKINRETLSLSHSWRTASLAGWSGLLTHSCWLPQATWRRPYRTV